MTVRFFGDMAGNAFQFETRHVKAEAGAIRQIAKPLGSCEEHFPVILVADANTWRAAGRTVQSELHRADIPSCTPHVFDPAQLTAELSRVRLLEELFRQTGALPVAVGSGTINDLVKLAAHRVGRPYLAVATAASMDGYNAFGASITSEGSKQTFDCPAPWAVIADPDVLAAAPSALNAAGYADLLAKVTAGADWMLADALGVEPIHDAAWNRVQSGLRGGLAEPAGVRAGDSASLRGLLNGLLESGFAMQMTRTSRPASGAEHQFSHLWDMEHHTFQGVPPLHGFKVGIATLAVTRLWDALLDSPLQALNVDDCCRAWPEPGDRDRDIAALFADTRVRRKAMEESAAKWVTRDELRVQLELLREVWPSLREKLRGQLLPVSEVARLLETVGAPTQSEQIGISGERLRSSFQKAYHLRRRFTVLDVAVRTNQLESLLDTTLSH